MAAFSAQLEWGLRATGLIALPAATGLIVLAKPILVTLFCYGHFALHDVHMTAASLTSMSIGLPAFMLIKVAVSGFYARKEIKTPVRVAACALAVDIILSLLLMGPFAHAGLALAVAIAAWVNSSALLFILCRQGVFKPTKVLLYDVVSSALACCAMAWFECSMLPNNILYWYDSLFLKRFSMLCGYIIVGVIVYCTVYLFCFGIWCLLVLSSYGTFLIHEISWLRTKHISQTF